MSERFEFWKCRPCHGTGREIIAGQAIKCRECDGTGNGLVDGPAREHQRHLDEIDAASRKPRP